MWVNSSALSLSTISHFFPPPLPPTHTHLLLGQSIFLIKEEYLRTVHHHVVTDSASNNNPGAGMVNVELIHMTGLEGLSFVLS